MEVKWRCIAYDTFVAPGDARSQGMIYLTFPRIFHVKQQQDTCPVSIAGILCVWAQPMRRHYIVTAPLIGWAHTRNDPYIRDPNFVADVPAYVLTGTVLTTTISYELRCKLYDSCLSSKSNYGIIFRPFICVWLNKRSCDFDGHFITLYIWNSVINNSGY